MIEFLRSLKDIFIEDYSNLIGPKLDLWRESQQSKFSLEIPTFYQILQYTTQLGQDLTKGINPILTTGIFDLMEEHGSPVKRKEDKGYDCIMEDGLKREVKCTIAKTNKKYSFTDSWSGNPCSRKVPDYLFCCYQMDFSKDRVSGLFLGLLNLDLCTSSWSINTSKRSQISNLKIVNEDFDKMEVILGDKRMADKYVQFILQPLKFN